MLLVTLLTASDGFCLFLTLWALQGLGGGIPACDTTRDAGVVGTGTVLPHCINEQERNRKGISLGFQNYFCTKVGESRRKNREVNGVNASMNH